MSDLRKKLHDRIELAMTVADGPVDRRELVHAAIDEIVTEEEGAFDLRWDADMRAIKRWQAAHPGNELVWPDHADLVVWLMDDVRMEYQRFYDFVGDSDPALVDAWHFTENVRVQKEARDARPEPE